MRKKFKEEKFIIDDNLLTEYDINIDDVLLLCLYKFKNDKSLITYLEHLSNRLLQKNLIVQELFTEGALSISPAGSEFLKQILLKSQNCTIEEDLEELALTLKELFPVGNKSPGHPWRGNTKEIINKLKRFKIIYNYSNQEIINATKHYVENMENNQYMRTLKYFILKKNPDGETTSDLASYIENAGEQIHSDWAVSLKGSDDYDD